MRKVNIHEAKTHLSRLVDQAAKGEAIIIAKAGKPMAQLTPIPEMARARRTGWLGAMAGKFHIPDDFDRMDEVEIARLFGAAD